MKEKVKCVSMEGSTDSHTNAIVSQYAQRLIETRFSRRSVTFERLSSKMLPQIAAAAILTNIAILELYNIYLVQSEMDSASLIYENPLHRVFVYGTLKRGEPNHGLIQNAEFGYAKFLGIGRTIKKYPLVIATKYNIPFLLKKPGIGNQILGEIYDVDTKMLTKLDELEEHPSFYVRTEDDVLLSPESEIKSGNNFDEMAESTKAWIYFLPKFKPALLETTMYTTYSNEGSHGLKYAERYLRDTSFNHREEVQYDNDTAKPEDLL
ncbi:putative gamma-glutamylcyclotransferase CG2811 isoform X2 [Cephus cinctus]|uniref:Gamma-glutamylcyclotransferase family protein n=1 Tax=Cephus cinctus TaxID=211228 RepID=A0AAJ7CF89_CEPCN|nr:putative gamma-glutamylcyclotransferase CG2811 isoform X2 [Cephus cinctus]